MNQLQKCLSGNLKRYRKKKNLSQEKLAEQAGISLNYIGLIECGKNYPSLNMLEKIANALNIDSIDLFDKDVLFLPEHKNLKADLELQIQEAINKVFGDSNK